VAEATHESATTLRISGACEPTRAKFGPQGRIDLQGCVGSGAGAVACVAVGPEALVPAVSRRVVPLR